MNEWISEAVKLEKYDKYKTYRGDWLTAYEKKVCGGWKMLEHNIIKWWIKGKHDIMYATGHKILVWRERGAGWRKKKFGGEVGMHL